MYMHNYKCSKAHSVKGEQICCGMGVKMGAAVFTPILQQICEALGNRYLIREWFNFMQVCHIDVQAWFHRSTKSGFYFFTRDSYKMMKEISERCLKYINYNLSEFKSRLVYGGQSFVDTLYFFLNLFIIASINKFFTQKQIQ